MGNNVCCQGIVTDEDDFMKYCMEEASSQFKQYFKQLQNQEIQLKRSPGTQLPAQKYWGSWEKNAQKTGRGILYQRGKIYYEGELNIGAAQGQGTIIWPNHDKFKGQFLDNRANGIGNFYSNKRDQILRGRWKNGMPVLNETMELKMGESLAHITFLSHPSSLSSQSYENDGSIRQVEIKFADQSVYRGEIKLAKNQYKIEGNGKIIFADGSQYVGEFLDGKMHGSGRYTWAGTGHVYEGEYRSNFREGRGKYYFSPTHFKEGTWIAGRFNQKVSQVNGDPLSKQTHKDNDIFQL